MSLTFFRWQADGKLPKDQQRGYRGVFHALYRIAKDEGVLTYWRGGGTTGEPMHLFCLCFKIAFFGGSLRGVPL